MLQISAQQLAELLSGIARAQSAAYGVAMEFGAAAEDIALVEAWYHAGAPR